MLMTARRPEFFPNVQGAKATLPFSDREYCTRLGDLRATMAAQDITATLLTSVHSIAYYSGFLYLQLWSPLWLHHHPRSLYYALRQHRRWPTLASLLRRKHRLHRLAPRQFLASGKRSVAKTRALRGGARPPYLDHV